jgi:hypothetical protein
MAGLNWPDIPPAVRDPSAPPEPSVYPRSCPAPVVIRGDPCQRLEPRHDQDPISAHHDDTPISPTSSSGTHPVPAQHLWPRLLSKAGFRAVSVSSKDSADTSQGRHRPDTRPLPPWATRDSPESATLHQALPGAGAGKGVDPESPVSTRRPCLPIKGRGLRSLWVATRAQARGCLCQPERLEEAPCG